VLESMAHLFLGGGRGVVEGLAKPKCEFTARGEGLKCARAADERTLVFVALICTHSSSAHLLTLSFATNETISRAELFILLNSTSIKHLLLLLSAYNPLLSRNLMACAVFIRTIVD
jgi:hypothetical protein